MSNEIKVGIAFLAGLFLLGASTFIIEDISLFKKEGPRYQALFPEIAGLAVGDPVLFGGFQVGKVSEIVVDTARSLALVTYRVDFEKKDFVRIHRDSEHRIGADLFGRAALTISFGTPGSELVPAFDGGPPGFIPMGIKPTDLSQVMNSTGAVIEEARGLPTEVKKLTISLNENQERVLMEFLGILQENRANIRRIIDKSAAVATAIADAEGTLGRLIREDAIYRKADQFVENAASAGQRFNETGRLVNEILRENQPNVKRLTDDLAKAGPDVAEAARNARVILEENRGDVRRIVGNVADITPKIAKSMDDINLMTENIVRGKGLANAAIMDEAFKDDFSAAIGNIGNAANEISGIMSSANRLKTFLGVDLRTNTLDQTSDANLFLRIAPSSSKEYYIGGTFYVNYPEADPASGLHARESTFKEATFTVLLGWRYLNDRFTFRAGAIESMPGFECEYSFLHQQPELKAGKKKEYGYTNLLLAVRAMDTDYENWDNPAMVRFFIKQSLFRGLTFQVGGENLLNDPPRFAAGFVFEFIDEDVKILVSSFS